MSQKVMQRIQMKFGGQVECVTITSRLDFGSGPDADLAYQWDTKHKLFSLVEVCALPCANLVGYTIIGNGHIFI